MNYYNEIKQKLVDNEIYEKVKDYSKERNRVITYFEVGRLLSEAGKHYGEGIIKDYSMKLTEEFGKKYTTSYFHLLKFGEGINVNTKNKVVTTNTVIGYVGGYSTSTAHGGYDSCTTGAHLHFGVANGFYNGYSVPRSNIITPPGFPNRYGWRFTSRGRKKFLLFKIFVFFS